MEWTVAEEHCIFNNIKFLLLSLCHSLHDLLEIYNYI